MNIWIGLFYFHRTLCHLEEILYLVSNDLLLRAALSGNHAELEFSKLFEAPYVPSVTGTRHYIRERQHVLLLRIM
jgi:hypothetical protein